MTSRLHRLRNAALASTLLAAPAFAADVTHERLVNANNEPHNWLFNHRTYDGQRFSPLNQITRENIKNLHIKYAVALGGSAANENIEATALRSEEHTSELQSH